MKYYLGIDLGGTNIVAGVVDETYKILSKASIKTASPRPAVDIMDDMVKVSREACEKAGVPVEQLEWVGIGAPGTINRDTGYIEYSNNLQFDHVPLRQYIADRLGRPVFVDNDANAAAYGEALAGAAKGVKDAVAITLGTGVGGGIIIDGKIYSGFNFAGAELGHAVIEIGGRQCTCGRRGCLEAYASATGLINLTKEAMEANPNSKMWTLTGGTIDNVSGKTAFETPRVKRWWICISNIWAAALPTISTSSSRRCSALAAASARRGKPCLRRCVNTSIRRTSCGTLREGPASVLPSSATTRVSSERRSWANRSDLLRNRRGALPRQKWKFAGGSGIIQLHIVY